jgi:hypothetical protein
MVTAPVIAPVTVGENVTPSVQVPLAFRTVPVTHGLAPSATIPKSPLATMLLSVTEAVL